MNENDYQDAKLQKLWLLPCRDIVLVPYQSVARIFF